MRNNGRERDKRNIHVKENKFKGFQEKLEIHFDSEKLLKQAFTHSS